MSGVRTFPLAAVVLAVLLAGCAAVDRYVPTARSFGVYKLDINQGNYLTDDMVGKLRPGLTKAQVRAILGTPLITSAFRENRWDYVYEYNRQGRVVERGAFTVFFEGDALAKWQGDEMPPSAAEQNRLATSKSMARDPEDEQRGLLDWMRGVFRRQ